MVTKADLTTPTNGVVYGSLAGQGCFCCGCPWCEINGDNYSPGTIDITLTHFLGGQCGNDCFKLNTTHTLEYFGVTAQFPLGIGESLGGCCRWETYVESDCTWPGMFIHPDNPSKAAYQVAAMLCLSSCVDNGNTTMTCRYNKLITVKGYPNSDISETHWQSDFEITVSTSQKYPQIDCCASSQIGLVFDDGGPTCDGIDGFVQAHPFDPCGQDHLADCFTWNGICGAALTLALTDAKELWLPEQYRPPSTLQKAKNFAHAFAKWRAAGYPKRTPEQVQQIYDEHCSTCPFFKDNACLKCGCPVVRTDNFRNKLLWATESCPDDPPRWEAEV